ncbi:Amy4N [Symbiodinium necroappetens]|uniref:Amy4N protein n=1 Tax=Symbiodinium necroappetens TaxID=1628268 RepID=A0A812PYT4_9DINO|nr:Amy4N [Symbiodinium necroappetens]
MAAALLRVVVLLLLPLPSSAAPGGRQLITVSCPPLRGSLHAEWGCPEGQLGPELLADPGFLGASGAWTTYLKEPDGASFSFTGNGVAVDAVADDDETPWHVQLTQPVSLDQGGATESFYSLCIQASSMQAGKIQFAVDADGALNFAVAGGGVRAQMRLAGDGRLRNHCFSFRLGPSEFVYQGRVALDLGAVKDVEVCHASLKRCTSRPSVVALVGDSVSGLTDLESGGCHYASAAVLSRTALGGAGLHFAGPPGRRNFPEAWSGCSSRKTLLGVEQVPAFSDLHMFSGPCSQETTAKRACLQEMRALAGVTGINFGCLMLLLRNRLPKKAFLDGLSASQQSVIGSVEVLYTRVAGNTFVYSIGHCEIWRCSSRAALVEAAMSYDSKVAC